MTLSEIYEHGSWDTLIEPDPNVWGIDWFASPIVCALLDHLEKRRAGEG